MTTGKLCIYRMEKSGPELKTTKKSLHVCALIVGESNRIKSISMIALAGCFTARNWKWNFIQQLMWICHETLFFAMRTDAVPVQIKFCFDSFPFRVENHKCVFQFASAIQKKLHKFFCSQSRVQSIFFVNVEFFPIASIALNLINHFCENHFELYA